MQIAKVSLASIIIALLVGCSSTGYVTKSNLNVPRVVKVQSGTHPEVAPYLPEFVDVLRSVGFVVGKTDNPDALEFKLEFNPNPFNIRVSASLLQHGVPIVSASATNPGWGTALARGSAVNGRAEAALDSFKEQLAELSKRITIIPEKSQ
jgi:hypothetical protein